MALKLSLYNVIQGPVVTSKASDLINGQKKVVLQVHPDANKPLVAEALFKLFNVEVKDINIIIRKGKKKMFKRRPCFGTTTKRAIVTLKDPRSFDILAQQGAGGMAAEAAVTPEDTRSE